MYNFVFIWTSSWSMWIIMLKFVVQVANSDSAPMIKFITVPPRFWYKAPGLPLAVPKYRFRSNASQHLECVLVALVPEPCFSHIQSDGL